MIVMNPRILIGAAAAGAVALLWAGAPASSLVRPAMAVGAQVEVPPQMSSATEQVGRARSGGDPPAVDGVQRQGRARTQTAVPPVPL